MLNSVSWELPQDLLRSEKSAAQQARELGGRRTGSAAEIANRVHAAPASYAQDARRMKDSNSDEA